MKNLGYWLSVVINIVIVLSINLIFDFRGYVFVEFSMCLFAIVMPSIILTIFSNFCPHLFYSEKRRIYREKNFEQKLYNNIKVKDWKDKVPQFLKVKNINNEIKNNNKINANYIEFFISETRRGEFFHLIDIVFGAIVMFILPKQYFFRYSLPIFIIWTFYNMLSIIIQRYNRPRLNNMLKKLEQRNETSNKDTAEQVA